MFANRFLKAVPAGQAIVIPAHRFGTVTVLPAAGATATVSFVDNPNAAAHDTLTEVEITVPTAIAVGWPFFRISSAVGATRVGGVQATGGEIPADTP